MSDPEKIVMRTYGAYGEKTVHGETALGVKRSTMLIDPDGRVAHHWEAVQAAGHAEQVADRLTELRGA